MSYPSYLEYFSSSIDNVSTASFKIAPTSNNTVVSHQQIQFLLPQNCLLDFRKLKMQFQVTSTGSFTRLPAHSSAYFSRISVEVGGQTISSFENANVLDEILRNNLQIEVDPVNEHSTIQRVNDPFSSTRIGASGAAGTGPETYPTDDQKAFFSIDLGTLARSIQPSIVAMMMLPQVTITLHLAENAVCASPEDIDTLAKFTAQGTQGTYSIINHNLIAEVYDVQDGSLMAMYQQTMQDQGYLELTYENWTSFSDVFNTVTRFSSSAQSLNKIVATFRRGGDGVTPLPHAYNAPNGAIPVAGYNNSLIASAANVAFQADVLGQPETQGANYQSAFFTQTAPIVAASLDGGVPKAATLEPTLNFSINSVKQPSYNCKASGWYDATKSGWGVSRTKSNSLAEWMLHRFSICQRLDLPDSKALRVMSGLNLKASNANLTLEVTGNSTGATSVDNVLVYLASTNIVRCGIGKQIQILH